MFRVITALAAEEAHSESTHSRAESSPRDAQGTPTQSTAQASIPQGTAAFQGRLGGSRSIPFSQANTELQAKRPNSRKLSKGVKPLDKTSQYLWVKSQKLKKRGKKQKKKVSLVKMGRNKDENRRVIKQNIKGVKNQKQERVINRIVLIEEEKDTSDVKSGDTEELIGEDFKVLPVQFVQLKKKSKSSKMMNFLLISLSISVNQEAKHSVPMQSQTSTNHQTPDTKEKGKRDIVKSPKKEITLQQIRAFETALMMNLLERSTEWIQKKREKDLYLVVQDYYKHIPPTGLGLILLGDLTTIWETSATSDDDFWKNQEDWEIIRWRLNESSGVHTLELEDGTMLHMLAERRYPLSRELMIRMLDHGMEVEDESETAITLIHLFILWTTEDGDDS
ncbi:hypothetical protein Tco_0006192 [Tanacetum coccineum]